MKQIGGKRNRGTGNPSSWSTGATSEGPKPPLERASHIGKTRFAGEERPIVGKREPDLRIEEDYRSRRGCKGDFARSVRKLLLKKRGKS